MDRSWLNSDKAVGNTLVRDARFNELLQRKDVFMHSSYLEWCKQLVLQR